MAEKYVKLKHVEELLRLIKARDSFYEWSSTREKLHNKVLNTVDWLKRNAKEIEGTE